MGWLPLLKNSIIELHTPGSQAISISIFGADYPCSIFGTDYPFLIIQLFDYMLLALRPFLNLVWGWLPLINIWGWLPLLNESIVGLHAPGSQAISLSIFGSDYPCSIFGADYPFL